MSENNTLVPVLTVSKMAAGLKGSEIIKQAAKINELKRQGHEVYNYTIGDFDPKVFPIPSQLTEEIIKAYQAGHTNYPAADGILELRQAVKAFISKHEGLNYEDNEYLIAGGARPLIYGLYKALINPGDKVIFPVPSWNNNHYCHLSDAVPVAVETLPENNFMPTATELKPHLKGARLLALCSPLNPTGTVFQKQQLEEICELVLQENLSRTPEEGPLYVMYDQIYWVLTHGETVHYNPVSLKPELRNYVIFVDGLSKAFAATGVRVGWAFGPREIISKMKDILGHVGAWAPKAEQVASAHYLNDHFASDSFLPEFKQEVDDRLVLFYNGFQKLKNQGFNVDAIAPQAAIYLTVKVALHGKKTADGRVLATTEDISNYLLSNASLACVPFYAFGAKTDSPWFRISVGTCTLNDINQAVSKLEAALSSLS